MQMDERGIGVLPDCSAINVEIVRDAIALITLDRPEQLNAWTSQIDPASTKEREDALFAWVGGQPDAREGVRAFLEKTTPAWKGNLDALDNAPFGEE
jgi:enoyl-CoA hydratase/carnithine racemase